MSKKTLKKFSSGLEDIIRLNDGADETARDDASGSLQMMMVTKIIPGTYQPRRQFDEEGLLSLSSSIKEQGILQPIIVRKHGPHEFEIIAGERRWRAAQMAGLQQVPVIVKTISNEDALAFGLVENIQRSGLNPIEEARAILRLIDEFKFTHEQVGRYIGRSRVTISNTLRLLKLDDSIQDMICNSLLEMGQARAVLGAPVDLQLHAAKTISTQKMSARESEKYIRMLVRQREQKADQPKQVNNPSQEKLQALCGSLSKSTPLSFELKFDAKGGGRCIISFDEYSDIEEMLRKLRVPIAG